MSNKFGDNVDDPRLEEAIFEAVDSGTAKVRTVMPGKVVSYNHSEQRAEVRPVIRDSYKDPDTGERQTNLPQSIPDCPVNFPQGGGFSITWPLEAGDPVELRISSKSMEDWLSSGSDDIEPESPRRHDLNDIIVDPGVRSFANALNSDSVDSGAIVAKTPAGQEIHLGSANPANWVARDDRVENELETIRTKLNSLITAYNSHTHNIVLSSQAAPSPQDQQTFTNQQTSSQGSQFPQTTPGDVASDKVKTE